ncbi:hypothetical protein [Sporomusa aerivorans]|uniref:hypothetical protein n=1 Tax=Sporomusa aerivorans TaxID=204936 RepID=UPI00352B9050
MKGTLPGGLWNIQARAYRIPFTPFTHNFWALAEPSGAIADQLHGLAFDPDSQTIKAIGNSSHWLLAVHDPTIVWSLKRNQPTVICFSDREIKVRDRWQAALHSLPEINALHLPYPDLWQHFYKKNSNTLFNTLGLIMGFASPLLSTLAPGIHRVISEEIIKKYSYQITK